MGAGTGDNILSVLAGAAGKTMTQMGKDYPKQQQQQKQDALTQFTATLQWQEAQRNAALSQLRQAALRKKMVEADNRLALLMKGVADYQTPAEKQAAEIAQFTAEQNVIAGNKTALEELQYKHAMEEAKARPKQKKLFTTERNAIVKSERNEILLQVNELYKGLDSETKNKIGVQQVFTTADLNKLMSSQEKALTGKGTDFGFFSGPGDKKQQAVYQQILDLAGQYRLVGSREWWRNREQSTGPNTNTELDDINAELERLDAQLRQ